MQSQLPLSLLMSSSGRSLRRALCTRRCRRQDLAPEELSGCMERGQSPLRVCTCRAGFVAFRTVRQELLLFIALSKAQEGEVTGEHRQSRGRSGDVSGCCAAPWVLRARSAGTWAGRGGQCWEEKPPGPCRQLRSETRASPKTPDHIPSILMLLCCRRGAMDNPTWSPGWGRLGSAFTSALDSVLVDSKRLNQFFPCVQVLVGRANITAAAFCDPVPEGAQAGAMSRAAAVATLLLEPSRMPQAGAPPRPALSTSHQPCSRWEPELSTARCQHPAGESPDLLGACWGHGIDNKKIFRHPHHVLGDTQWAHGG